MRHIYIVSLALTAIIILASCEDEMADPVLQVPTSYESASFTANVGSELAVLDELASLTASLNSAESKAQTTPVADIAYPAALSSFTQGDYQLLTSTWLIELVKSANDDDAFQNPGSGVPAADEEGGLLGGRLLDEHGLELEQMIEKGAFGAALYNHALTVINGDLSDAASIDQLVAIVGTSPSFDPATTKAAATYARRRSDQTTETGFFYDMKENLITAKAAIEAGSGFEAQRDQAIEKFLLAWEKSNFATVVFYCNATKAFLQTANGDEKVLGDAMHAYAEGVGFAHGFKRLSQKVITDNQIDEILELLLAPEGQAPSSYRLLNDASLLINLDQVIDKIQSIYEFTDQEIAEFFVNDPS